MTNLLIYLVKIRKIYGKYVDIDPTGREEIVCFMCKFLIIAVHTVFILCLQ